LLYQRRKVVSNEGTDPLREPAPRPPAAGVPKGNLLIVDDKPANLRLLASMLVEQGYKVRSAINGSLALTATRAAPPDMILLDINMPEMNGYEVCERLKADEDTHDIPIIFISALDEIQDKVKAFTVGGVDYITKPFQLEEVLARVETHLALRRLQKQLQDANSRFEQELALAAEIQASFLPSELPKLPGWQLTATLIPARETSGDFYDVIPLSNGRLGLVVADVTDKGTGAALYMALSRTLIRTYAVEFETQPELAFNAAHRRILADTETNQFVTVFYGILDAATGTLTYANAGHNPPYLFSKDGSDAIQELDNTGPPLGLRMFKDVTWEQRTAQLAPGDVLVLYSDGITEAQDDQEEFFEEERLLEVGQASLGRSAQEVQDTILAEVDRFVGDAPQVDDITLMVLARQAS
jgi:sigma-B regulation protein RsbU (phosphoserine phosphatase)